MTFETVWSETYIEEFEEGFVIGFSEGFKKGYEIVLRKATKENVFNGLKASYPDDVILNITHVSKEELEEYKEEYCKEISFPHSSI